MNDDEEIIETETNEDDEVFSDALSDAALNFDASLKAKFSDLEYKKLRTIGAFIMRGLPIDECCVLARVSYTKLQILMEENSDVKDFIIFKQISFKAGLLNTLSASATIGRQAKSAGYLLEKKYPKEFDQKKVDDGARQPDVVERAIAFVRSNSDKNPLVIPRYSASQNGG